MRVAIIPARKGSKRIQNKNIKLFLGIPIIAYSIKAALESCLFDKVIVSTDCINIARIAIEHGAETPFLRDPSLSDDDTPLVPVINDAIKRLEGQNYPLEDLCCIYSTAPMLRPSDLTLSFDLFKQSCADYCFGVAEFPSRIQRALMVSGEGGVKPYFPEYQLTRTQDLMAAYYDAGQFCWGKKRAWLESTPVHENAAAYRLNAGRAIDIDTNDDWYTAELIYRALKMGGK